MGGGRHQPLPARFRSASRRSTSALNRAQPPRHHHQIAKQHQQDEGVCADEQRRGWQLLLRWKLIDRRELFLLRGCVCAASGGSGIVSTNTTAIARIRVLITLVRPVKDRSRPGEPAVRPHACGASSAETSAGRKPRGRTEAEIPSRTAASARPSSPDESSASS